MCKITEQNGKGEELYSIANTNFNEKRPVPWLGATEIALPKNGFRQTVYFGVTLLVLIRKELGLVEISPLGLRLH